MHTNMLHTLNSSESPSNRRMNTVAVENIRRAVKAWNFEKTCYGQSRDTISLVEQLLVQPSPPERWADTQPNRRYRQSRASQYLIYFVKCILFEAGYRRFAYGLYNGKMLFRASGAPPGGAERVPDFLRKPTFHLVDEDCTLPQCPRMGPGPSGITNDGDLSETNGGGAHRAATMRL